MSTTSLIPGTLTLIAPHSNQKVNMLTMSYFGVDPMFTVITMIGIVVFVALSFMAYSMLIMSRKLKEISENTKPIVSGQLGISINNVDTDKLLSVRPWYEQDTSPIGTVQPDRPVKSIGKPTSAVDSQWLRRS